VLFGPELDAEIMERERLEDGLGINAWAYRGVRVVNGWFKGVSADGVSPSQRLFYGQVRTPHELIHSPAALDLFGIRYVLATVKEAVHPSLIRRATLPTNHASIVLYENPVVGPEAFVADDAAASIELPTYPGCRHDDLLCRDVGSLARLRQPDPLVVTQRPGHIEIRAAAAPRPRLLVVTEMFRPAWKASSESREMPTVPIAGGLLGVRLPQGETFVRLVYRPFAPAAATIVAFLVLFGCGILLTTDLIAARP
jgi:hypothetical protein